MSDSGTTSGEAISFKDVFEAIRRNVLVLVVTIALGLSGGYYAYLVLPKKFKVKSTISIHNSYFVNNLIDDILPGISDNNEQRAERLLLIRRALNDSFLEKIGFRYDIYKPASSGTARAYERDVLLKRIEVDSAGGAEVDIRTIAKDASRAFQMNQDVVEQVLKFLGDERYGTLIRTRDAIQSQVQELNLALQGASSLVTYQKENLKTELEKLELSIEALTAQYTENHPEVLRLKEKARIINEILRRSPTKRTGAGSSTQQNVSSAAAKEPMQEVYNDLVKKLSYLNVAIEMSGTKGNSAYVSIAEEPRLPPGPMSPNKQYVLIGGFAAGLLLGCIIIAYRELKRGTFLAPAHAARAMNIVYLGELPPLIGNRTLQISHGPGASAVRQILPSPELLSESGDTQDSGSAKS